MASNVLPRSSAVAGVEGVLGRRHDVLAAALLFISGACGLVWQMAWTAGFGVALGHEIVAVLAVLGAFFGGLSAGSFLLAAPIERSTRPGLWYAALEALAAIWGLGACYLLPHLAQPLASALGPEPHAALHALVAFAVPLVLLLPATIALGATLPAMERQVRGRRRAVLPILYASNTAGAVVGTAVAVFLVLPHAGLRLTAEACAAMQLGVAAIAAISWRSPVESDRVAVHRMPPSRKLRLQLFGTGLLGIGYEALAVRVLSQVTENTIYTYAVMLVVFLMATAAGAVLIRSREALGSEARINRMLMLLAGAVLLSGCSMWWLDPVRSWTSALWSAGFAAELAGEAVAGGLVLAPPALVMGAVFSQLCVRARDERMALGRAVAWNTAGCALAPAVVAVLMVPMLGPKAALVAIGAGYLLLATRKAWRSPAPAVLAVGLLALLLLAPALRIVDVPAGGRVLGYRDGAMASVSVVSDADDVARLHINNRVQEGSSAGGMVEMRLAQLPLLLHSAPRTALFLGLGTGYTAHSAAVDPRVRVTAVELLPEVIDASSAFMMRPTAPRAASPVEMVAADARRFVLGGTNRYDVIVADLYHPARSGAAGLYTAEHFRAVRERLAPGGIFCQWVALHQMDIETLRGIVSAFMLAYPDAVAVLAANNLDTPVLGLVARPDRPVWSMAEVEARFEQQPGNMPAALKTARLDSAYAVLGSVWADAHQLQAFARGAVPNTDDHPWVAHQAARVNYQPESSPRDRLASLLRAFHDVPAGALVTGDPAAEKLRGYWHARQQYVSLGLEVRTVPDARTMLDTHGPGLLEIVRASPHFQPAADSLEGLATALQSADYPLSQRVLAALRQARVGVDDGAGHSVPSQSAKP